VLAGYAIDTGNSTASGNYQLPYINYDYDNAWENEVSGVIERGMNGVALVWNGAA